MIFLGKMTDMKERLMDRIIPVFKSFGRHCIVYFLTIFFGFVRGLQQFVKKGNNGDSYRIVSPQCLYSSEFGTHSSAKVEGTKFHFVENGSTANTMVLCLHDFSDFWYGWRNQLKGLSDSFWVVALDLKGFGDSDKPFMSSKYSDEVVLAEIKKFVDVLQENDKKIVLMGHGLGGQIGWRFVERYPETVSKFISISTPHPNIWLKDVMRSWRSLIENRWLYVCRLPFLPEMEMMANDLEIFDSRFQRWNSLLDVTHYAKLSKEAYRFSFSRIGDWCGPFNYYRNLNLADAFKTEAEEEEDANKEAVQVEVLIIAGNNDPQISIDVISQTTELVQRSVVHVVNGAGHFPHQEQPFYCNSIIYKFLEGESDDEGDLTTEEEGSVEISDSMVGSYISKFNTWGQTDDSKIKSVSSHQESDWSVADNDDVAVQSIEKEGESLGMYQRSVAKMKTFGSEMMNSYKDPLDKALVSGTELQLQ